MSCRNTTNKPTLLNVQQIFDNENNPVKLLDQLKTGEVYVVKCDAKEDWRADGYRLVIYCSIYCIKCEK